MNESELRQLMDILLAKKIELRKRTEAILRDTATQLSPDWDEQAVELENAQVLDELGREAIEELGKINLAISRLEMGRYGNCSDCGEPIAIARLRAVPWATRCTGCEVKAIDNSFDRRGHRSQQ